MTELSIDDAELLAAAHLDLLAAQSAGVTVLGRADGTDLLHIAHTLQAQDSTDVMGVLQASHDLEEVAA